MKITDEQLLDAIWMNQLRLLPKAVIQNYIGGGVSVCGDRNFDYERASHEHRMTRHRVTNKIGRQQLLKRLGLLAEKGLIQAEISIHEKCVLVFMIYNDKAKEAFQCARKFWLKKGVPTGYSKLDDGRGCANTTEDVDVDSLLPECEKILIDKYGDSRPKTET